jgi:hypothetical protein
MPAAVVIVHATHPTNHTSAAVWVLAAIGVLLVLLAALWGIARWLGLEPEWWQSLRRVFVEAGWHAEAAWADFADWIRVGR